MTRGVIFEVNGIRKHTDDDFDLHCEPVDIPFPDVKTKYIEKEFGHGSIDLTEANGKVYYKDRTFSLTFVAQNKVLYLETLKKFVSFIHGRELKMTFWWDKDYYYLGRAKVNQYKCNDYIGTIPVQIQTRPFKYKHNVTIQTDIITTEKLVVYKNERMDVVPTFKTNGNMNFTFKDNMYALTTGETIFPNIVFSEGDNVIKWTGTGEVTVSYQEGAL